MLTAAYQLATQIDYAFDMQKITILYKVHIYKKAL